MKRIYILILAMMTAGLTNAQLHQRVTGFSQEQLRASNELGEANLLKKSNRGGSFFYEDFANGFDGNNGVGAWTVESTGSTSEIWVVGDATSPAGISIPLRSTTADNGYAMFDMLQFNPDGLNDLTGSLTSPEMDMSALSSVIVDWEQYFVYCCFARSPLTFEISLDGGETWVYYYAHGDFPEDANTPSANPLPTTLDVSCVAAGQPSVIFRWSYNVFGQAGYGSYWWGLDDITISENPYSYDVEVMKVNNADVFREFKYSATPLEQAPTAEDGGLVSATVYRNAGVNTIDSAQVTVEVLSMDESTVYYTSTSDYFSIISNVDTLVCPSKPNDTLIVQTGWVPENAGDYILRSTLTATVDFENETTLNVADRIISYTLDEFGHDRITADSEGIIQMFPEEVENSNPARYYPAGYGTFYLVNYNVSVAYGLTVRFGPDTDPGTEFDARLYEIAPGQGVNDADIVASGSYTVASKYIPASPGVLANSRAIYFEFDEPYVLSVGLAYFVAVANDLQSEGALSVLANGYVNTDGSSATLARTTLTQSVWFPDPSEPAVRMIISDRVGVDEVAEMNGVLDIQNMPNPAMDLTNIRFALDKAQTVTIEIMDLAGRVIHTADQGKLPAGSHSYEYNVSNLQNGVYFYSIIANGSKYTKKMVVQH